MEKPKLLFLMIDGKDSVFYSDNYNSRGTLETIYKVPRSLDSKDHVNQHEIGQVKGWMGKDVFFWPYRGNSNEGASLVYSILGEIIDFYQNSGAIRLPESNIQSKLFLSSVAVVKSLDRYYKQGGPKIWKALYSIKGENFYPIEIKNPGEKDIELILKEAKQGVPYIKSDSPQSENSQAKTKWSYIFGDGISKNNISSLGLTSGQEINLNASLDGSELNLLNRIKGGIGYSFRPYYHNWPIDLKSITLKDGLTIEDSSELKELSDFVRQVKENIAGRTERVTGRHDKGQNWYMAAACLGHLLDEFTLNEALGQFKQVESYITALIKREEKYRGSDVVRVYSAEELNKSGVDDKEFLRRLSGNVKLISDSIEKKVNASEMTPNRFLSINAFAQLAMLETNIFEKVVSDVIKEEGGSYFSDNYLGGFSDELKNRHTQDLIHALIHRFNFDNFEINVDMSKQFHLLHSQK